MARKRNTQPTTPRKKAQSTGKGFHLEFKNDVQGQAWGAFQKHDVLFLLGPAGCGKTFLACAFAVEQVLNHQRDRIVLTRPIVEAGESLGYLPGEFEEKVHPYMLPMYDCMDKLIGRDGPTRDAIRNSLEIAPLAYMRGRSFAESICIFDEAQNATYPQLKLFLTRFEDSSKLIVTGDPMQSDLGGDVALVEIVKRLRGVKGIGVIQFNSNHIVRHPLVADILNQLES